MDRKRRYPYAYYANGLRASKTHGGVKTDFVLDGGNVVLELQASIMTAKYIRAMNLVSATIGSDAFYYLYNAHGDVVQLANNSGTVTKTYVYDAFGVEKNADGSDVNPFRYCGEYWDKETGTYYLRARNYDPRLGRFTSEDTHWNTTNMLYGDKPIKWNERDPDEKDPVGLNLYKYKPDINAIMQSGNFYIYCMGSPLLYHDFDGNMAMMLAAAGAANIWNPVGWVLLAAAVVVVVVAVAVAANEVHEISKKQQKIDEKKGISGTTPANPEPGPPKNNQDQNKQAKEAADKHNLSKEGRERLHRDITKQNLSRDEIFEVAESIAREGGKYVN